MYPANVQKAIEWCVKNYNYKPLPLELSNRARKFYEDNLPDEFYLDEHLFTKSGELLAVIPNRLVIGDYGAFVEINPNDIMTQLYVPKGQEFRLKPDFKGKYQWYTTKQGDCKIYKQVRPVKYADYKVGMYYISPYEIKQVF